MAEAAPRAAPPRWPARLAWALWALAVGGLLATAWLDRLLRQAGRPDLAAFPASGIPLAVAAVSAVTVGAVLAARRPAHPVGWLLAGLGLSVSVHGLTYSYTRYGLVARPGSLPGAAYLAGFNNGVVVAWISCAGFVLLLTPTGRLPSPRWRWWARLAAAAAVLWLLGSVVDPAPLRPEHPEIGNPLAVPALFGPLGWLWVAALLVLVALVVAAGSLVLRFRRARGTERQQLRWLAWAAALASAALAVAAVFQPARRRVQAAVDRRFNRRRHDAARIIEGFAARLRDQVDLDVLHGELLAVVDQTMQPTRAFLWLRPPGGPGGG